MLTAMLTPGSARRATAFILHRRAVLRPCLMHHDKILILDFGAQYTQLIARRVREAKVYCEIHPCDVDDAFVREFGPKGIILSGSHMSAYEESTDRAPAGRVRARRAGARHLLRHADHGAAARRQGRRRAKCASSATPRCARAATTRCSTASRTAASAEGPRPAEGLDEPRRQGRRAAAGLQADGLDRRLPDRRHGRRDAPLLRRAVPSRSHAHAAGRSDPATASCARSAAAAATGTCRDYVAEAVQQIRAEVGSEEVILGLSGGVDSSVAAALIHRAIGEQLTCVFVDTGLLRLNEAEQVMDTFAKSHGRQGDRTSTRAHAIPGGARGRHRSRREAQDHRPRVRRGVPGGSGKAARTRSGWRRARSIPT